MKELIQKNAQWWADKISSNSMNWNNGDDSPQGGIAFMLGNMVAQSARKDITEEKLITFKAKIVELVEKEISEGRKQVALSVDYHPDIILSIAAKSAGIDSSAFPCKSSTYLDTEKSTLLGKVGYGKPQETIPLGS